MVAVTNFLFFFSLFVSCQALLRVGMTEFYAATQPEFINFTADGECAPSFECDIMAYICDYVGEECVVVPVIDLDARLGTIESGEVDFSISIISVTPERSERVHFVRPHYYYAGAQLFVLNTIPEDEHPSWEDIKGKDVCILANYYAIAGIEFAYEPNLIPSAMTVDVVLDGTCEYVIADSTDIIDGMVESSNALIEFGAPYGIAVSHADREGLGAQIGDALVSMMLNGTNSVILQLEEKYLVSYGFPMNQKLTDIVMATTEAGVMLPPEVEDAIWDE
eukprot:TRINITY_DN3638_c0_g1_i1.p1 TRINITY_DN3638_c0_g1~~TRINITY_DN3638_c0_g1_i1.p1  ORF type:complete len:278 (-),score=38.51 TRINITY_DN3638_c0_g1_i1:327-1160(-)